MGADSPTTFKQKQIMNALESIKVALAEAQLLGLDPAKAGYISADSHIGIYIQFHHKAPELFHHGDWSSDLYKNIIYYTHPSYATKFIFSA